MKQIIRLTEDDLHRLIEKAVRRIVDDYDGEDAPVDQIVGAEDWDDDDVMANNFGKNYRNGKKSK